MVYEVPSPRISALRTTPWSSTQSRNQIGREPVPAKATTSVRAPSTLSEPTIPGATAGMKESQMNAGASGAGLPVCSSQAASGE